MDQNAMWARPVVFYDGFADSDPKSPPLEDEDLVEFLTDHPEPSCSAATCPGRECPAKKSHPCWSPASYAPGATRGNDNVLSINYAVFDLDHLKPGDLDRIRASVAEFEHVVHSTHSHASGDECYRLVFPLTRPIQPSEWVDFRRAVIDALDLPADPSTVDLSRLYAGPDGRAGVPPFASHRRGAPLDVDEALLIARGAPTAAATVAPATPAAWNLKQLREKLAEVRRSKASSKDDRRRAQAEILGRVLDGEPVAERGARDATLLKACGILAYWLPAGCPWEVALEVLRPSLSKMDVEPEGFDHWVEEARDMFARQSASRAASDVANAAERERFRSAVRSLAGKATATPDEVPEGFDWEDLLIMGREGPRSCEHNAQVILTCAPELRGTITWNVVTKQVEFLGGPLAGVPPGSLDTAAAAWLQRTYKLFAGANVVGRVLVQVAREHPRDPIAEYLGELAWDGTSRLDGFLETYLGVDVSDAQRAKYVRAVSRKWLISLAARALRPGCKVDTVLILEGAQGAGKSSALEELVGGEWFLDTQLELGDKDTMQAIASAWLVELGELASFRRAEVPRIKQFITSKVDKFRPPYGRVTEESPRRCVLVGTCNPEDGGYLFDRTGNRRYWPVRVGTVDVAAIRRDREQILAEAVAAFRSGERWHLVGEEVGLAASEAAERLGETTAEEAIDRWWHEEQPARRPAQVTLLEVAEAALKLTPDRVDGRTRHEIGHAMRRLGFERRGRDRYYVATDALRGAPQRISAAKAAATALASAVRKVGT